MEKQYQVLKRQMPYKATYYYQKSEVIYQLTYVFCQRFLPKHGDRTVDQMVQAARSGKQNIVEGTEDGVSSTEMYIKLLNVARSSLQELREDFRDFLKSRTMPIWQEGHPRYEGMIEFCRKHNKMTDYTPYFQTWTAEEMANIGLTLCYMTDTLLNKRLKTVEEEFVTQGGIKERMHAARTGYRKSIDEELAHLRQENQQLKAEILRLNNIINSKNL